MPKLPVAFPVVNRDAGIFQERFGLGRELVDARCVAGVPTLALLLRPVEPTFMEEKPEAAVNVLLGAAIEAMNEIGAQIAVAVNSGHLFVSRLQRST